MRLVLKGRFSVTVILVISFFIALFSKCVDKPNEVFTDSNGRQYAGTESCKRCHSAIYDSFLQTTHFKTSMPASEESIKGAFNTDSSFYRYTYSDIVAMEKRNNSLYQVEYYRNQQKEFHPIDITIGSGTRGQSFLYWKNNKLFQLPVSYFTSANQWANSPGFPDHNVQFNRVVSFRCLECHATFAKEPVSKTLPSSTNNRAIIYGITCEKCHGPGQKHVDYHSDHLSEPQGKYIINPASFSKIQKLDMCALCHSGSRGVKGKPFSFTPGDTLDSYLGPAPALPGTLNLDVHLNQYGLLKKSKCYISSADMTCFTCHDVHKTERGNRALFSQRCQACHKPEQCGYLQTNLSVNKIVATNCIDCHMPLQPSSTLRVQLQSSSTTTPATIRSHLIAIYPQQLAPIKMNH